MAVTRWDVVMKISKRSRQADYSRNGTDGLLLQLQCFSVVYILARFCLFQTRNNLKHLVTVCLLALLDLHPSVKVVYCIYSIKSDHNAETKMILHLWQVK